MLAPVPTLVFPVVPGAMEHAQVRRRGVVEQLRDLREGVGIGVVGAHRMKVRKLVGERAEAVGRLVGERVGAADLEHLGVTVVAPPEPDGPVVAVGLVGAGPSEQHHVDDRLEGAVEQDAERRLRLGLTLGREPRRWQRVRQGVRGHESEATGGPQTPAKGPDCPVPRGIGRMAPHVLCRSGRGRPAINLV